MSKSSQALSYTTKSGLTVLLSTPKNHATPKILHSRMLAFYLYTGTFNHVVTKVDYKACEIVQRPLIVGTHKDYTPLIMCFDTVLHYVQSGTIKHALVNNTGYIHESIANYCNALTFKAHKYYAGLEGGLVNLIQLCDMIEASHTSYGTIVEALMTMSNDEMLTSEMIHKMMTKISFKVFRSYTYQLGRDTKHLDVDGTLTLNNGDIVSLADILLTKQLQASHNKALIDKVASAMTEVQLNAMMISLSNKQQVRFAQLFTKKLEGVALETSERKAYGRYCGLIVKKYESLTSKETVS